MNDQNNIQDELSGLKSSLPVSDSPNLFSVPEGYFDGLAERILAHVKEQNAPAADELQALSPLLAGLSKKLPYSVPKGYFDETADRFPFLLNEEESPVLAAVGKAMPFVVPQGYFETIPQQVLAKLVRPKAKVVPFFSRPWARVAVAAAIIGIVFFGGYRLLTNKPDNDAPAATALLPANPTEKEVAESSGSISQYFKNISIEELNAFMNTVPVVPARRQQATLAPEEKKEMREWLKDVPEKDIKAFLDDLPTADEKNQAID